MNATAWIALATLGFMVMGTVVGGVWHLAGLIGGLKDQIREAVEGHEGGCSNYDPNTAVKARTVPRQPTVPGPPNRRIA